MLLQTWRIVKFAFQNFFRNAWLSMATVSVLVLTLVSANILLVMNVLGRVALSEVKGKIDVSVHFKPETDDSRVQTVKIYLLSLPEVRDVDYVSPAEALSSFSQNYKDDPEAIESLSEVGKNPFGATLVVKARDIAHYPKIISALDDPLYANAIDSKDFDDRQQMISRVEEVSRKLTAFGLGVSAVFLGIALLIVWNTIRVSVFTRKEEIGIMRLVGASDSFIRAPFYVESLLWSGFALAVCAAVVWPALRFLQPYVQGFFGSGSVDIVGFYGANALAIIGAQFGATVLLSLVTTKMATARYLKV